MRNAALECVLAVISTILIAVHGTAKGNDTTPESDFTEAIKTIYFVDKSLLIRDFFEEIKKTPANETTSRAPVLISVLTGPRFGKTTNNNMVKQFLEIVVDDRGRPVDVANTSNYKLFSECELAIVKEREFVKTHFGKHPVISMDCGPLSLVTEFDDLLVKYREIILKTFSDHRYLLSVNSLWVEDFNKTQFEMFINPQQNSELHKYYIFCAFSILSKILHSHFGKPVIVLMDDFNAIENSPAFKGGVQMNRILYFIEEVTNDLIVSNRYVEAALLVGTMYPRNDTLNRDRHKERFLRTRNDTQLWKYYGLDREEVKGLLSTYVKNAGNLDKIVDIVVEKYTPLGKHFKNKDNIQPCSVWSVMQYFKVLVGLFSGAQLATPGS